MERSVLLLTTFIASASAAYSQLAPQDKAPLRAHMTEINAEWNAHADEFPDMDRTVSFTDEADRIATHLHMVRAHLAAHGSEGLSPDQGAARHALLGDLEQYADRGLFPRNMVLPYRNPVFIDPYGTACAVGQLMIESGASDLAMRIDDELELAYVREMDLPEIGTWATTHGFTADELAWIQPAYAPPIPWFPLGPGLDGPVKVLLRLSNGDLLVAGTFSGTGDLELNNVAVWDGAAFNALGSGVQGYVNAAVEFEGNIILGGAELNGYSDLAIWNGSEWEFNTVFDAKYPLIHALHVHEGELYAAGEFSGFAGIDDMVMRRTDVDWEAVEGVFNNTIHSLASHNGSLVAGGAFTGLDGLNEPVLGHVAVLEGSSWTQLGNGLDATVLTLLGVEGQLYAGGDLIVNELPTFGMARMAAGASEWELLMTDHENYISPYGDRTAIYALADRGENIVYGGSFMLGNFGLFGTNIGIRYNEGGYSDPLIGLLDGKVNAVDALGTSITMGGTFQLNLPHIARTDLATGIQDRPEHLPLTFAPNPTVDLVAVQAPVAFNGTPKVRITDASGRLIDVPVSTTGDVLRLDTRSLASGMYQVELSDGEHMASGRFVKR